MQIGSKFTIGVHIITAIDVFKDMDRVNSEFLAGSIGVNPVIVRSVISQLRAAGLVQTRRGSSGAELAKSLDEITLYDVDCPVGRNIHHVLDGRLADVQRVMEDKLKQTTLADIVNDTLQAMQNESNSEKE